MLLMEVIVIMLFGICLKEIIFWSVCKTSSKRSLLQRVLLSHKKPLKFYDMKLEYEEGELHEDRKIS
jgi:hypothetical protein